MSGTLYGIGLGPGDPELITLKAMRLLQRPDVVVASFAKAGRKGHAYDILKHYLASENQYLPLYYPVTTEIDVSDAGYNAALSVFYDEKASEISAFLQNGKDVVIASEGDPLLYGSFMHLFLRLKDRFKVEIVAGVTGMAGCWNAAQLCMTWGDDILTILPATLNYNELYSQLINTNAAVIMKLGRHFVKAKQALLDSGLYERAIYVERGTMDGQIIEPLKNKTDDHAPYFAMILVGGEGRRP